MKLITDLTNLQQSSLLPSVATIGFFDGVHCGHRSLIGQVCRVAAERSLATMLVTFSAHPRLVMQADYQPRLLSTLEEKVRLLSQTGVDYCVPLHFTRELATLSAHDFMQHVLRDQLKVHTLVIGYDHRFGHNRAECFEDYVRYGQELGMEVIRAEAYQLDGVHVSSSVVRTLLDKGDIAMASHCMGYDYSLEGEVIGGQQIGRTLGFPTANLQMVDSLKIVPTDGVYAVRVHVDNEVYKGMLNIGCRPTIDEDVRRTIEVHLLHFEGNLYGKRLRIEFLRRIRGEQKFCNREALAQQLRLDAEACEE